MSDETFSSKYSFSAMQFLIIFLSFVFVSNSSADEPINVAAILPLTGSGATLGESCRNGILLATEDNADSKIVSFLFENDELTAKNTVASYQKLKAQHKLSAVITLASGPSKAVAPLAQSDGISLVGITNDPEILTGRDKVFLFWLPAEEQGKALYKEAVSRGYKKVARVSTIHQGSLLTKQAFDQENKGDLKVVFDEEFSPEIQDFRTSIEKIRRSGPFDSIFINLFIGQAGLFARQVRELGIDVPLFNGVIFENASEVKASNGALVGQWYVQIDEPQGKFLERYEGRFPGAATLLAGNCYDVATLIMDSKRSGKRVDEFLKGIKNYSGAMGTFSVNSANTFVLPATVKIVTENGFKKIGFTGESS